MSAPYHLPERKTEHAFHDLLGALSTLTGLTIGTRFENVEMVEPYCEIACETAEPDMRHASILGNWNVAVRITVRSHYARGTDASVHDDYVAHISDALMVDGLAADLNNFSVTDFTALLWTPGPRTNRVEEHSVITELTGTLKMMPQ
jgi:hypothetical protein